MSDIEDYIIINQDESSLTESVPTELQINQDKISSTEIFPINLLINKKKNKLDMKKDYSKTEEVRKLEVNNLLTQLAGFGIVASIPGMKEFLKISQLFIKEGVHWQGRIRLTGTNRVLCGFLTNRKNKTSDITLKYEKE
jgi:hypothetical protein